MVYTDPADIALAEFGYDPLRARAYSALTPTQRLTALQTFTRWVAYVRKANAIG